MAEICTILSRFAVRFMMIYSVVLSGSSPTLSANTQNCSSQADCSRHESCCDAACVTGDDCLGHSCSDDSNCKPLESCCNGVCSEYCIPINVYVIIALILVSCILLCSTSLCFYFTCRRPAARPYHYSERVIVGPSVTAKTITARCATQSDTPYQAEAVPGYPPHYVEYMQYNVGAIKEREPPPPYNGAPPWRSGEMHMYAGSWQGLSTPYL